MRHVTTVVVGAGQSGLAMSRELASRSIDHVVLERGRIGNNWLTERWDSLRLLTPNWMSAPAGHPYDGPDPDGFMVATEFASRLHRAARHDGAPVAEETRVLHASRSGAGYIVQTDQGAIACDSLVIATGGTALPRIPSYAADLPKSIRQMTPLDYRRPGGLPGGAVLVVGASASGLQIAREINASGRRVILAVGNHLRLPRRYRGADILWWMHELGVFDIPYTEVDDLVRVRQTPSLPLSGDGSTAPLDLNTLQASGIEVVGRLMSVNDGTAWFSGGLANLCAAADLKLARLLDRIDVMAAARGLDKDPAYRLPQTRVPAAPRLSLDLAAAGIETIVWATGLGPDHGWLNLPVFDAKGAIRHDGGVVGQGVYVMGLRYLRSARSAHIEGAARDARALAAHLFERLDRRVAA